MQINDIVTVTRKEIIEISHMRESKRAFIIALLIPVFILGVSFPIKLGSVWADSPISIFTWILAPFIIIAGIIADSIAGERERHTLETLLATRLPTAAILLGKIFASMTYALTITIAIILLGIISVNVAHWNGGLMVPRFLYLAGGFLAGILTASIAANLGVLISVRSRTARQAQQSMGFAIMILFFLPSVAIPLLPKPVLDALDAVFESADPIPAIALAVGFFMLVDIVMFLIAFRMFRRSKLL